MKKAKKIAISKWLTNAKDQGYEWAVMALIYTPAENASAKVISMSHALFNAFVFAKTPQGANHWFAIHDKLVMEGK